MKKKKIDPTQLPGFDDPEDGHDPLFDDLEDDYDPCFEREVTTAERLRQLVGEKKKEKDPDGHYYTQKKIAEALDISEQTLSHWCNDKDYNYRDSNLKRAAKFFKVDLEYLKCEKVERRGSSGDIPGKDILRAEAEDYFESIGILPYIDRAYWDEDFEIHYFMGLEEDYYDPFHPGGVYMEQRDVPEVRLVQDENGKKRKYTTVHNEYYARHRDGYPIIVKFPDGEKIMLREKTWKKQVEEFKKYAVEIMKYLVKAGHLEDVAAGTIPDRLPVPGDESTYVCRRKA